MKMKFLWVVIALIPLLMMTGCQKEQKEPDYYDFNITDAEMSTGEKEFFVPPTTTSSVIQLQSNMWWTLEVIYPDPKAAGWLSITPTKGRGNVKLELTLEENFHNYSRSAVIKLKPDAESVFDGYSFTFTQQICPKFIAFSGDEISGNLLNVGPVNGTSDVKIHTNIRWTATYKDATPWYSLSTLSGGGDDVKENLTSDYEFNSLGIIRNGSIIFTDGEGFTTTLFVKQKDVLDVAELTIDNGLKLIANWTRVVGTDTYTFRFYDPSDVEIPGSAITGISKTVTSYDLSNHFSSLSTPYAGIVKAELTANTISPLYYSISDRVTAHTHFGSGSGDGSPGNEYEIANVRHLQNINSTGALLKMCYKQVADIDFTGVTVATYIPVGRTNTVAQRFAGIYSGAKDGGAGVYKIMNTSFLIDVATRNNWGIFGFIGPEAKVGDLEFVNCKLTITDCATTGDQGFAHAVGSNLGGEVHHITTTNCEMTLNLTKALFTGSVVGNNTIASPDGGTTYQRGKVSYCTTQGGFIKGTVGDGFIGGIVGSATNPPPAPAPALFGIIEFCANKSTPVTTLGRSAGIAGGNNSVYNCYNEAAISGNNNATGGIIALINFGGPCVIQDCYNTGTVTSAANAQRFVGGILGRGNIGTGVTIQRCFNSGDIIQNTAFPSWLGGILGDYTNLGYIYDCFNTGNVGLPGSSNATNSQAGGIVGNLSDHASIIANCYNTGKVGFGSGNAGRDAEKRSGIVGNTAAKVTIKNCYYLEGTPIHNDVPGRAATITGSGFKSPAELKNVATYVSWDFENVWAAPSGDYPYPQLKGLPYKPMTE